MSNLKSLTSEGHHVHLGRVEAHSGVRGNIQADLTAKSAVIQKIIDANDGLNAFTNEELNAAEIDDSCNISPNAHENHEWPTYPVPEQEGVDDKELEEWQELLEEGTRPDGDTPEKGESMQKHANVQMSRGTQTKPPQTLHQMTSMTSGN